MVVFMEAVEVKRLETALAEAQDVVSVSLPARGLGHVIISIVFCHPTSARIPATPGPRLTNPLKPTIQHQHHIII